MTAIQENLQHEAALMLRAHFDKQRAAYLQAPIPDYQQRKEDLLTLKRMINENRDAIIEAISSDYGNRSRHESLFAEIIAVTVDTERVAQRNAGLATTRPTGPRRRKEGLLALVLVKQITL